ncbi:S8 family serine peptidase [Bacillus tianshenii]|uniref:S8 family peptidase n=1 Tax=Sutcliffiella tianshenii TaxID=1463404 RepID=UPI001CD7CDD5|nr:S8 family peptidase [Bacillus tianshenii]MCA1320475.1 S8 family serine peptidase [Bacillus tianshenii]
MTKQFALLFLALFALLLLPSLHHAETAQDTISVSIQFREEIHTSLLLKHGAEDIYTLESLPIAIATIPGKELDELKREPSIIKVEIDQPVKRQTSIVTKSDSWAIEHVLAPRAWKSGTYGAGVKVGVLDSGISPHPDLSIRTGISFVSYTQSTIDDFGHGTHVAGIIASNNKTNIVGVAPEAALYPIKVLDQHGIGTLNDVLKGIDWAISNKLDILNLSFGTEVYSETLKNILDRAYAQNMLIVASTGNEGNNLDVFYPAKFSTVIAVSAVDQNNSIAPFSSIGDTVEIAAPGIGIYSTYLDNGYTYMNGTSMAAPFVTGTLALLKSQDPSATNDTLRKRLRDLALDIGPIGKDKYFGYGLVQAPASFDLPPLIKVRGWVKENGFWYYHDEDGKKVTGWLKAASKWYFFNSKGEMQIGWHWIEGDWYYLKPTGDMHTGWLYWKEQSCYLEKSGAMHTGWLSWNNRWYHLDNNGYMTSGWLFENNKWYYLQKSGVMSKGWMYIGNKWYYFYSNGSMAAGVWIGEYYVGESGAWEPDE